MLEPTDNWDDGIDDKTVEEPSPEVEVEESKPESDEKPGTVFWKNYVYTFFKLHFIV